MSASRFPVSLMQPVFKWAETSGRYRSVWPKSDEA